MTFLNATPDGSAPRPTGTAGPLGPFVCIGLPQALAARLAGPRPILSIDPKAIPSAGLNRLEDAVVGCLLLGSKVDALDIIEDLFNAGYCGAVTVVAPPMPDPRMVERELKSAARTMTITLVVH